MKNLLEAGVHFGHQTRRWNPKMSKYIYGSRNGIHILDLQKSLRLFNKTYDYVAQEAAQGKVFLFVGTKKQARDSVRDAANNCGQYYINHRWLGGLLTNFNTIKTRIVRLKELTELLASDTAELYTKKELSNLKREHDKLERNLGGIKDMPRIPDVIFVLDINIEHNAIAECRKLGIPIVALVDTNCDPELVDYPIPGNDDAIRACKLFVDKLSEAILVGFQDLVDRAEREDAEAAAAAGVALEGAATASEAPDTSAPATNADTANTTPEPVKVDAAKLAASMVSSRDSEDAALDSVVKKTSQPKTAPAPAPTAKKPSSAAMVKELRERTGAGMLDCKKALEECGGDIEKSIDYLREKGLSDAAKKAGRIAADGLVVAVQNDANTMATLIELNCETDFVAKNEGFQKVADNVAGELLNIQGADAMSVEDYLTKPLPSAGTSVGEYIANQVSVIGENIQLRRFSVYSTEANAAIGSYIHGGGKVGVLVELKTDSADAVAKVGDLSKKLAMHICASNPTIISAEHADASVLAFVKKEAELSDMKESKVLSNISLLSQSFVVSPSDTVEKYLQKEGESLGCKIEVSRFVRYELGEGIEKKVEDFAKEVQEQLRKK